MEEETNEVKLYNYDDILHMHCRDCFQLACSEQENCILAKCSYCSIALHSCKLDDHETICLMMQVFCPNSLNGCPTKVLRRDIAKHLETCPANVIHCGMEWNRYPLYSRERYTLTNIYNSQEDKIKQMREHWVPFSQINPPKIKGQLDIELAISDQRKLAKERKKKMAIGKWKLSRRPSVGKIHSDRMDRLADLIGHKVSSNGTVENRRNSIRVDSLDFEDLTVNDNCGSSTGKLVIDQKATSMPEETCENRKNQKSQKTRRAAGTIYLENEKKEKHGQNEDTYKSNNKPEANESPSWKKRGNGVRFQEAQTITTNGPYEELPSVLDSDEKDLVYIAFAQQEEFHTEKEAKRIRDDAGIPQIPSHFHEQINKAICSGLGLNVIIETIPKFQKNYPMCSIPCGVDLRRDQYCSHFKNVHTDVHGGLNYWIQQRCPLAQYGCPYVRERLRPGSKEGCLVFDHEIDNFGVMPSCFGSQCSKEEGPTFDLLSLPFELIEKIVIYLDSFSINQFAKACRTTREVCRGLLQRRGIVILEWQRGYYSDNSVLWKVRRKRWLFSPSFSYVSTWRFTDEAPIGEHLKNCPFFIRSSQKSKIGLPTADFKNVHLNGDWR